MSVGNQSSSEAKGHQPRLVEIGWIIAGWLSDHHEHVLQEARVKLVEIMKTAFPDFEWQVPIIRRRNVSITKFVNPVKLLEIGVMERDIHHWDFAIVFTSADLMSTKAFAFGVVSRALDSGVISLSRLSHSAADASLSDLDQQVLVKRVSTIAAHYFGHFVGLEHSEDPNSIMRNIESVVELDSMEHFNQEDIDAAISELEAVADPRLEEKFGRIRDAWIRFYLQSVWVNRRDILDAVSKARPWQFPLRLGRLTAAAMSAMFIMLMTAEVWEISLSQTPASMLILSFSAIFVTTFYVLIRQNLIIHRSHKHVTEQMVTTNISTGVVVLLGMLTTYVVLFGITVLSAVLLFSDTLVSRWIGETDFSFAWHHYGAIGSFVGSLGLSIGSLGASIEPQEYFRFVTFVDEEL